MSDEPKRELLPGEAEADAWVDSLGAEVGGISPGEYIRGIKNGNIDPSFDNAVKAILWAADEIERLRKVRDAAQHVLGVFKESEALGYRSRERQFAIDILEKAGG